VCRDRPRRRSLLLQPRQATLDFGIAADSLRGLTEIKAARDITSGVVPNG
jgi:hypothetical protein